MLQRLLPLAVLVSCSSEHQSLPAPTPPAAAIDWRDEIIYQIVTDRFANGDPGNDTGVAAANPKGYHGGDFQGVINHVDYLKALGVTAVWLSPVVKNIESMQGGTGYHGYWAQDLGAVNPHFGDLGKLKELVQVLHAAGIKVILDVVTNHMGRLFYYDKNGNGQLDGDEEMHPAFDKSGIAKADGSGPAPVVWLEGARPEPAAFADPSFYHRMGSIGNFDNPEESLLGDFGTGLRDLATEKPEVRTALEDVFAKWITDTDADGFRIDTVKHVEHGFWAEFCPAMRRHATGLGKPHFFMFGEAYEGNDALLGAYTHDEALDSVIYFSQKFAIFDGVFKNNAPTTEVDKLLAQRSNHGSLPHEGGIGVAPRDALVNFIDNHDIPRFLNEKPSPAALRSALVYLYTWDGIPCLYYGTEQDFSGGVDPANREDLWSTHYATTGDTFGLVAKLTALRKAHAALRRGDITVRWSTGRTGGEPDAGILAFERRYEDERLLVVINTNDAHESSTGAPALGFGPMKTGFPEGTVLKDLLQKEDTTYEVGAAGALLVTLPARGSKILAPVAP